MARRKTTTDIDFSTLQFYDKVEELLKDAGRYAHAYKLRENLNDSATRFKVEHVFQSPKYYGGSMQKLRDEIHFRRRQCFATIAEINRLCERLQIMGVRDREALTDLLLDEYRREGWRKAYKAHRKQNEIVTLQTLEREYRKTLEEDQ